MKHPAANRVGARSTSQSKMRGARPRRARDGRAGTPLRVSLSIRNWIFVEGGRIEGEGGTTDGGWYGCVTCRPLRSSVPRLVPRFGPEHKYSNGTGIVLALRRQQNPSSSTIASTGTRQKMGDFPFTSPVSLPPSFSFSVSLGRWYRFSHHHASTTRSVLTLDSYISSERQLQAHVHSALPSNFVVTSSLSYLPPDSK